MKHFEILMKIEQFVLSYNSVSLPVLKSVSLNLFLKSVTFIFSRLWLLLILY